MFYGFLRVNRTNPLPPTPPKKKKITTHIPKYSYIFQNPMYYGSITLEFRIDSKPLWLPTKDLVFFRFIIFMCYPHIKTFNKIKTFSNRSYLIYPCNSKQTAYFFSWPHHSVRIFETHASHDFLRLMHLKTANFNEMSLFAPKS